MDGFVYVKQCDYVQEWLWETVLIYWIHDALPPDDNDEGGDETSQCHESAEDAESDDATCEWNWEKKFEAIFHSKVDPTLEGN